MCGLTLTGSVSLSRDGSKVFGEHVKRVRSTQHAWGKRSEVTVHRISHSLGEEYSALNNSCLKKHPKVHPTALPRAGLPTILWARRGQTGNPDECDFPANH